MSVGSFPEERLDATAESFKTFIHAICISRHLNVFPLTLHTSNRPNIVYWLEDKLYLNITNQCTNNCYFCLRKLRGGISGFNLRLERDPPLEEILEELWKTLKRKRTWREIVFCGFGEPTARLCTVLGVADWLNDKLSAPLRVNTNGHGYLINPDKDVVAELLNAGVSVISISLNAHTKELYDRICRPEFADAFKRVLDFTLRARDAGLEVEVTAVAVPEVTIRKVEDLALELGVAFRARPYVSCVW